jgi:hypothetical protein
MEDDMEGLKVNPHGMGWVGQASMCESVRSQQKTKFIIDEGEGHWQDRQNGNPCYKRGGTTKQDAKFPAARNGRKSALQSAKPACTKLGIHQS